LAQTGEATEAVSQILEGEQRLERQRNGGYFGVLCWGYHLLARASLALGRVDEARRLGDLAVESSSHHRGDEAHARQLLGDIATHPDRFDAGRGEAYYRDALALAEPRGMRPVVAHCHFGLGKLYRRTGQGEAAQDHLTAAAVIYRTLDMRFWLEQIEAELNDHS